MVTHFLGFGRWCRLGWLGQRLSWLGRVFASSDPDYGVFEFVDLFSDALKRRPFRTLGVEARRNLVARFEHKVSDHMPLWLRLPLP